MRNLVVLLAILVAGGEGRPLAAKPARQAPAPRIVLWVAAHPDDEILAAPLLADWCLSPSSRCTLLVLTQGEAGHCLLPQGCRPDLATVRSRELARAARQLHARVELWDLPDGGGLTGGWEAVAGGEEPLVARVAAAIAALHPEVVLTFDPRHGTTCHGDHRKAGQLVVSAVAQLDPPPRLELLETLAAITNAPFSAHFAPAAPPPTAGIVRFDVSQGPNGRFLWSFVPILAGIHRSQFPADALKALQQLPADQRAVYSAPAETALASDQIFDCQ